jgi:hypothetical protein
MKSENARRGAVALKETIKGAPEDDALELFKKYHTWFLHRLRTGYKTRMHLAWLSR